MERDCTSIDPLLRNPSSTCELVPLAEIDVHSQLQKILGSRGFCNSRRLQRFISFASECVLHGKSDDLKEYLVGIKVFDRGPTYDPKIDPIVRVEARRLRAKLKRYYASIGRKDKVLIHFPKGSYRPVFRLRTTRQRQPTKQRQIAVLPFVNLTGSVPDECFSNGLREELIHRLAPIPSMQVLARNPLTRSDEYHYSKSILIICGSVRSVYAETRVTVQLIDGLSGTYIWSETYGHFGGDALADQQRVADAVATRLELTCG